VLKWQEIIVLCVDLSTSMGNEFRAPDFRVMTRLAALKEATKFWIGQKAQASRWTATCVVRFSRTASVLVDWTILANLPQVLAAVDFLEIAEPWTNIAGALETALDQIKAFETHPSTWRQPKVVLVTDGRGNIRRGEQETLLQRARAERVPVYPIAVCNQRDDPDSYDRNFLFRLARETRGRFTTAQSLNELKRALGDAR
jgi:Mg-chelatase subunit ChlD